MDADDLESIMSGLESDGYDGGLNPIENEDEDAMNADFLRRASIASRSSPPHSARGNALPQDQLQSGRPSVLQTGNQPRASVLIPDGVDVDVVTPSPRGALGAIYEGDEVDDDIYGQAFGDDGDEDDDILGFGGPPDAQAFGRSNLPQASNARAADKLRERAEFADTCAERYSFLIQHSATLVSEVKSALYDADHSGQAHGAEVLLDEVKVMLAEVSQKSLVEAGQLQKSAEKWLGNRKSVTQQLKANHKSLNELVRRRAENARKSNEECRAECDRLWRQIRDWETEIEDMPRIRPPGSTMDTMRRTKTGGNEKSTNPIEMGGLTLEGAHSLLRAFAAVLRPHMTTIIPRDVDQRSPSEAVALEFLAACSDQGMSTVKSSKASPPPLEIPLVKRCDSTPAVMFGDQVESVKPTGLLPIFPNAHDPYAQGAFINEQQMMLAQIGDSY